MRSVPLSLWLLVAAQIEAQSQAQLPTAIRKMSPDAGEKFHHEYCAFAEEAWGAPWPTTPLSEARAAIAERDAPIPAANSSAQVRYLPPFAPHADGAGPRTGWISRRDGGDMGGGSQGWQLLARAAAGARARLEGRQWACPGGTSSCADIGYPNSCCQTGETCMEIQDTGLGPVGCCPSGSTCDGAIADCASGNTACASDIGGGCCIPGFVCRGVGCVPSAPVMTTITTTSTSVMSAPTPSTVVVTVIITQSQSQPPPQTSTTTSTVPPTKASTTKTTTSGNGVSAPVRPTSSSSTTAPPSGTNTNTYCPTGFYACLASAGGGCCQTGRDCKTTSCPPVRSTTIVDENGVTVVVPATAVPTGADDASSTATCASGWFLCDGDAGPRPGCCPSGYSCGTASCLMGQDGATASVAKDLPGSGAGRAGRGVEAWRLLVAMVAVTFIVVA